MEKENKFDKSKYDQRYIKDNYKRIVMNLRPHIVNYIDSENVYIGHLPCIYVHQLQQILKLCQIEKEIVI